MGASRKSPLFRSRRVIAVDRVVGLGQVSEPEHDTLKRRPIQLLEYLVQPGPEPTLHLADQRHSEVAELVDDSAAVFHVRHTLDQPMVSQAVHDPSQSRRGDIESLREGTRRKSRFGPQDEHHTQLRDGKAEGSPFLEPARIGASDQAPEEVEYLFLKFDVPICNSCHMSNFLTNAKYSTSGDTIALVTSEFESSTENTALKNVIIAEIQERGAIPFRDFMDMALYHPIHGYYTSEREKMGRDGDYLTSPEVSPLFGAMIGRQVREMWQSMDSTDEFTIVECGAGNGTLARDILAWAKRAAPDLYSAASYQIVEISEPLRRRQRARLEADGFDGKAAWSDGLPGNVTGCILSNELLDAMPVHRVTMEAGRLREVFVGWDGTGFTEHLHDPSPSIAEYFGRLNLQPGEGCFAEVNLAAVEWAQAAGQALGRGFVLTFDYGYGAQDLYASWRKDGTLLGFYRQNPTTDPYARIGHQDLTSHVDFTSIKRAGETAGLTTAGLVTQSEFLGNLGIHEALQNPTDAGLEEHFARRRAITELMDPADLGRIKVLLQSKGVNGDALSGFSQAES